MNTFVLARWADDPHRDRMRAPILPALLLVLAAAGPAQSTPPVRWDVTSTVVDLTIPGAPGFLVRMAKGKSRAERKCVPPGQDVAALLAPDPKAQCHIDSQRIAGGHYAQVLTCPQKRGGPMRIVRGGTFDADGFTGRAEMTGPTPKGAMRVVLDQRAARVAGKCRG